MQIKTRWLILFLLHTQMNDAAVIMIILAHQVSKREEIDHSINHLKRVETCRLLLWKDYYIFSCRRSYWNESFFTIDHTDTVDDSDEDEEWNAEIKERGKKNQTQVTYEQSIYASCLSEWWRQEKLIFRSIKHYFKKVFYRTILFDSVLTLKVKHPAWKYSMIPR